jgi:hypothetical protein
MFEVRLRIKLVFDKNMSVTTALQTAKFEVIKL